MKHRHYWKQFLKSDRTGGFIICKCGAIAFLKRWSMEKFKRLLKDGVKGNQIRVTPYEDNFR